MDDTLDGELVEALSQAESRRRRRKRAPGAKPSFKEIDHETPLAAEAPAPRIAAQVAERGGEPTAIALNAWQARVGGAPIIDVAHGLGLSIESAKVLLREVHAALRDDLKDALELNRSLDLERIDGLLRTYYPAACSGSIDSAQITIRALQHRAKLVGLEPLPDPGHSKAPQNVLVWIQNQLPQINRIVDALPAEAS